MLFSEILVIVLLIVAIIQQFIISKQLSISDISKLIGLLAPKVEQTETKADDIALSVAKALVEMLKTNMTTSSTSIVDTGGDVIEKQEP